MAVDNYVSKTAKSGAMPRKVELLLVMDKNLSQKISVLIQLVSSALPGETRLCPDLCDAHRILLITHSFETRFLSLSSDFFKNIYFLLKR
jgi:hypothetical protein